MEWRDRGGADLVEMYEANPDNELLARKMGEAPKLTNLLYWDAFHELSSERQVGMSLGPIPFSSILNWANYMGFTPSETRALVYVMRQMDGYFLSSIEEKRKRQASRQAT